MVEQVICNHPMLVRFHHLAPNTNYVVSNYNKGKNIGWFRPKYITRKDRRYVNHWYRNKKSYRKVSNGILRRYKGDTQDGGWYKKLCDLWWIVY